MADFVSGLDLGQTADFTALAVHQRLPPVLVALATEVAALHTDGQRRRAAVAGLQRVPGPTAALAQVEDARAAGALGVVGLATLAGHGHQERAVGRLQVADD